MNMLLFDFKPHHFGYVTNSLSNAENDLNLLGFEKLGNIYEDYSQGVLIMFLKSNLTNVLIELIEPMTDKRSVIRDFLHKRGSTVYHACFAVNDINESINQLRQKNFKVVKHPFKAIAFDNRLVAFLFSNSLGLIELLEL